MRSAQHALKQVLALVVAVSLVISIAPLPSRAEAQPSHAGLPLSNLPPLARFQAQRRLSTNSASLSISPRLRTSADVKGFNPPETQKKSVALTNTSDRQRPRTARRPTQAIEKSKANAV